MSVHLITGKAGYEHVKASDHAALHAAIMGGGEFVLEGGEQFACQVVSNNKVRIFDGEAMMQGRHIRIDPNTYEETTHDNGAQGYKRIDLIVLTYTKDEGTGIENAKVEVIKGTPAESNPAVPEYETGDILNSGELKNQMLLYKIPFDGLSIGEPVKMFKTVSTMETMKTEVDAKVEAKIAEMDDAFAELEGSIDDKIAEAGKPLSSSAADWGMIENYGEYSADAKTVGEEFEKVNESLQALPLKEMKVITMTMPSDLSLDTRYNLPSGFTYDNTIILSSMVNNGTGWQLSEPNNGFVSGIMNDATIYIYSRSSNFLNKPVKIVIGRY